MIANDYMTIYMTDIRYKFKYTPMAAKRDEH